MTDQLKPENKSLVERVLGYGTARTYNRHEIDRILDAARTEGRRSGEASDADLAGAIATLEALADDAYQDIGAAHQEGGRATEGDKAKASSLHRQAEAVKALAAQSLTPPVEAKPTEGVEPVATFQDRVQPWMMACFGAEIAADRLERNDRFIEEALELCQASGYTADRAHQLVDYVFGRPDGEINQEVGGVMVTLAAHCLAHGVDMHAAAETELARIWTKVEQIREKQKSKPKGSALPIAAAPQAHPATGTDELPADVVRLVIAARKVAFEDTVVAADLDGAAALKALDEASEAFADRVAWEDEPEDAGVPLEKEEGL